MRENRPAESESAFDRAGLRNMIAVDLLLVQFDDFKSRRALANPVPVDSADEGQLTQVAARPMRKEPRAVAAFRSTPLHSDQSVFGGLLEIFIPKLRSPAISRPLSGPSRFRCWAHSNNKKPECAELFFERWGFTTTLKRENRVDAGRLHKSRQQFCRGSTANNAWSINEHDLVLRYALHQSAECLNQRQPESSGIKGAKRLQIRTFPATGGPSSETNGARYAKSRGTRITTDASASRALLRKHCCDLSSQRRFSTSGRANKQHTPAAR